MRAQPWGCTYNFAVKIVNPTQTHKSKGGGGRAMNIKLRIPVISGLWNQ